MKIAIYHNLMSGGAKRALFEMICRLARQHTLDVFTLSSAEHAFCDVRPFVNQHYIFDFETRPLFSSPFGVLNHGVRAADLLRLRPIEHLIASEIDAGGYDVAFVYASDQLTNGPILLQYLKTPSVCYCNDPLRSLYDPPLSRPYSQLSGLRNLVDRVNVLRWWYQSLLRREDRCSLHAANLLLVNSYFSRETVYRIYAIQPFVCYLGIDTQVFRRAITTREDFVLSVGTVNPIKGHDFIIRSLAMLPADIRPPLIVVGNFSAPDEKAFLQDLAQASDVTVEFRVMVTTAELVNLYNQARMTLYAPVLEPFGFVPLESMACGTPVIGVAEGGVRESIRHGEVGLLTDRDPQQFSDAIALLLNNPEYAEQLGARGPEYVQQCWNWDNSVMALQRHLTQVPSVKK